jgi:hypothetical protein
VRVSLDETAGQEFVGVEVATFLSYLLQYCYSKTPHPSTQFSIPPEFPEK